MNKITVPEGETPPHRAEHLIREMLEQLQRVLWFMRGQSGFLCDGHVQVLVHSS